MSCRLFVALVLLTSACTKGDDVDDSAASAGLAVLGAGSHGIDGLLLDVIGTEDDGLRLPRDLDFNPSVEGELWVVSKRDDSVVIFSDAGADAQTSRKVIDPFALHFMDSPSSLDFGAINQRFGQTFGTCQESRNTYNGRFLPDYFMGPTLWSAEPDIFGESNPEAVEYLSELYNQPVDLGSHLDMLHESPLCMGITWEADNVYWVFDGYNQAIARYDFVDDHGMGYDDHSDGIIAKYVQGEVAYVEDVPSHLELDADTGLLYVNDTGNNRVVVLDTTTGQRGRTLPATEPGTTHYAVDGAELWTLIDGAAVDPPMVAPSGLDLVDGTLFITDNATSRIYAFDLDGNLIDFVDTGLPEGALMGLRARALDDLWFVDAVDFRVLRLQP
ncbi:MAG: hypothetical protein H6739_27050 [Alphaproteobacteria bacterium]|nr:hypothetical protein [Alphaproteobacteria bacterium]